MYATLALPAARTTARHAAAIRAAWAADAEMPELHGSAEDAVRVFAVRAAVYAETGDERQAAALAAPAAVELTGLVLAAQLPGLRDVIERSGHAIVHGDPGARWEPAGRLHRIYAEAFGPVGGRHWAV